MLRGVPGGRALSSGHSTPPPSRVNGERLLFDSTLGATLMVRTGFINPRGRAGPRCEPRKARGAWRTRRRVRERRATKRGDAPRPSPRSTKGLRRQRAICGVAPPRSTAGGTPSSSLLASGPLALATRFARSDETGSNRQWSPGFLLARWQTALPRPHWSSEHTRR